MNLGGGARILRNIGLPELVVETAQKYIQIALALAADLPRSARRYLGVVP
jgi:predicted O-linked N-acetylglucosamine transferase (SPINDLY family)